MPTAPPALIEIATRHQSHYERLKSAEVKKYDEFLIRLDKELREELTKSEISDLTRARLERKIRAINALVNGVYTDYKKVWSDGVKSASLYEAGFEVKSLGVVVANVEFSLPSDSQISAAVFNTPLGDIGGPAGGSLLESYFDEDVTKKTVRRIEGAVRSGYAQGETTAKIVRNIRGTAAAGYNDGILSIAKGDVETVVRTALQHASSQAREEVWRKNDSVIKKVRIVATLDFKTSGVCRALDSQEFDVGKGPRPAFHPNCRTTTSSVIDDRYKFLSEGRQRSARDFETGKVVHVDANTSYYQRLKNANADMQDSVIGPTRGKLLRDGGLSAERFAELQLGKNFEPLTLDEMRKLEPIAFNRAGL